MKNLPKLLIAILGCELVGILATPFTISSIPMWYAHLNKPSFSPPNWIFGPAWTILYFLMGVSFYLVWKSDKKSLAKKISVAKQFFLGQLFLNFLWSWLFFGLKSPLLGLLDIVAMWVLIMLTILKFYPIAKIASYLMVPYFLWVSFASILNLSIVALN